MLRTTVVASQVLGASISRPVGSTRHHLVGFHCNLEGKISRHRPLFGFLPMPLKRRKVMYHNAKPMISGVIWVRFGTSADSFRPKKENVRFVLDVAHWLLSNRMAQRADPFLMARGVLVTF